MLLLLHFWRFFLNHSKSFVIPSLVLESYFTCDYFSLSYGVKKVAISANLGQLTRDIFRAINA